MGDLDKDMLKTLVFQKAGIKIDETDPSFAVAVMAEVLLLHAAAQAEMQLRDAAKAAVDEMATGSVKLADVVEALIAAAKEYSEKVRQEAAATVKAGSGAIKVHADMAAREAGKQAKIDVYNVGREMIDSVPGAISTAFKKELGQVVQTLNAGIQEQAKTARTLRRWGIITALVLIVVQFGIIGYTVMQHSTASAVAPMATPGAAQRGWR